MRVTQIRAYLDRIVISLENAEETEKVTVRVRVPLVCGPDDPSFIPGRVVLEAAYPVVNSTVTMPRFAGKTDLLVYRFDCGCEGV